MTPREEKGHFVGTFEKAWRTMRLQATSAPVCAAVLVHEPAGHDDNVYGYETALMHAVRLGDLGEVDSNGRKLLNVLMRDPALAVDMFDGLQTVIDLYREKVAERVVDFHMRRITQPMLEEQVFTPEGRLSHAQKSVMLAAPANANGDF